MTERPELANLNDTTEPDAEDVEGIDAQQCNGDACEEMVDPDDDYYATPCGTFCNECMREHVKQCEICAKEFELDDLEDNLETRTLKAEQLAVGDQICESDGFAWEVKEIVTAAKTVRLFLSPVHSGGISRPQPCWKRLSKTTLVRVSA